MLCLLCNGIPYYFTYFMVIFAWIKLIFLFVTKYNWNDCPRKKNYKIYETIQKIRGGKYSM